MAKWPLKAPGIFEQLEMVGCFPHPSRDLKKSPGSWRFGSGQGWERPLFTGA